MFSAVALSTKGNGQKTESNTSQLTVGEACVTRKHAGTFNNCAHDNALLLKYDTVLISSK